MRRGLKATELYYAIDFSPILRLIGIKSKDLTADQPEEAKSLCYRPRTIAEYAIKCFLLVPTY